MQHQRYNFFFIVVIDFITFFTELFLYSPFQAAQIAQFQFKIL